MLHAGEVHLVEAHKHRLLRQGMRTEERLKQLARPKGILEIEIAEQLTAITPIGPHGNQVKSAVGCSCSTCLGKEPDEPRLSRA